MLFSCLASKSSLRRKLARGPTTDRLYPNWILVANWKLLGIIEIVSEWGIVQKTLGDRMGDTIDSEGSGFAERMRALRERAGLSQAELARASGLTKGAITKLEQGHREPAWATVLAICNALKIPCTEFAPVGDVPERPMGKRK